VTRDVAARQLRSPILFLDRCSPELARRMRRSELRSLVVTFRHRGVLASDVILGSYPRSGSTWLRLMLSDLIEGGDVGVRRSEFIVPMVGFEPAGKARPSTRRLLRSHEPYRPVYRRGIYLVRDVRDVAVSYLELQRAARTWRGSREEFLRAFVDGRIDGYGPWHSHARSWLAARSAADVLVIRYEDLLAATHATLTVVARFVGIDATDRSIAQAIEHNSIERVRRKEREDEAFIHALGWRLEPPRRVRGMSGGWQTQLGCEDLALLRACEPAMIELGYAPISGAESPGPRA
jgi:hypothetical protein